MKVWIDGNIVEGKDAKLSVTDHGFLYGDGIFEGMRAYSGRLFRLEDHLRQILPQPEKDAGDPLRDWQGQLPPRLR